MYRAADLSTDIQDFLAVSARYLALEEDIPITGSDWAFAPAAESLGADLSPNRFEVPGQRCA